MTFQRKRPIRFKPLVRCPGIDPFTGRECQALIDTRKFSRCSVCRGMKFLPSDDPRRPIGPERESATRNALPPVPDPDLRPGHLGVTPSKKHNRKRTR